MAILTQNEKMSVIGLDLPFVHGFPAPSGGTIETQDLLALAHKCSGITFAGGPPSIPVSPTPFFTAGTFHGGRNRTRFGSA